MAVFLMLGFSSDLVAQQKEGLKPMTEEGFETGDWRNFRPQYNGDAEEWIRPRFEINSDDPLHGKHSLRWTGGEKAHNWYMLSNAFYLKTPLRIGMDVRVEGDQEHWETGLVLMENQQNGAGVYVDGQHIWLDDGYNDGSTDQTKLPLNTEKPFRLVVKLGQNDQLTGLIKQGGKTIEELHGRTGLDPGALALSVQTDANSDATIDYDQLTVHSGPYRMRSGQWTRSPQFVALPRQPDVEQDQGNWVGGQSVMKKDGSYLMWYRIRNNETRGAGYGFARSKDGLNWKKQKSNPVLTYDPDTVQSSEKIDVLHVDGLYRAWYTLNTQGSWYTAYATSENGTDWTKHGLVVDERYCKDPTVVYRDGTYFMYSIHDRNKIGIYTSSDGVDWKLQNVIPNGMHAHVAATYVKRTGTFHLYSTGGFNGVRRASSSDGIHFGPFTQVWTTPRVGLDDWADAGITYFSFITDGHGQIQDDRTLPVYYQARNEWNNNIPDWLYHGGERVVLAGKYEQLYENVPARVRPDGGYEYESFPFEMPAINELTLHSSRPVRVVVNNWTPDQQTLGSGTMEPMGSFGYEDEDPLAGDYESGDTQVQWELTGLSPGRTYELLWDDETIASGQADRKGNLVWTTILPEDGEKRNFRIRAEK